MWTRPRSYCRKNKLRSLPQPEIPLNEKCLKSRVRLFLAFSSCIRCQKNWLFFSQLVSFPNLDFHDFCHPQFHISQGRNLICAETGLMQKVAKQTFFSATPPDLYRRRFYPRPILPQILRRLIPAMAGGLMVPIMNLCTTSILLQLVHLCWKILLTSTLSTSRFLRLFIYFPVLGCPFNLAALFESISGMCKPSIK